MEDIIAKFLFAHDSASSVLRGATIGIVAGTVGALFGVLIRRITGFRRAVAVTSVIFVVVSLQILRLIKPNLQGIYSDGYYRIISNEAVENLSAQYSIFNTIFRLHPEAKTEFAERLRTNLAEGSDVPAPVLVHTISADIIDRYMRKYSPHASNEAIINLLTYNLHTLEALQNNSELCVSFFFGTSDIAEGDIPNRILEEGSILKAAVIESGAAKEAIAVPSMTTDQLLSILEPAYLSKNYQINDLFALFESKIQSSNESCRVAIELLEVLVDLGPASGVDVYKGLIAVP